MFATALSWWLGGDHDIGMNARALTMAAIAVVAFVKVHLVGMYFMQLRHAPAMLRFSFMAWTVVTCALVIGLFLRA